MEAGMDSTAGWMRVWFWKPHPGDSVLKLIACFGLFSWPHPEHFQNHEKVKPFPAGFMIILPAVWGGSALFNPYSEIR